MKRVALVLSFAVLLPAAVFCGDFSMSAGGGLLAGYTFTRYTIKGGAIEQTQSMDRFNYGGLLFFDATYGEFSLLLQGGNNEYIEIMKSGGAESARLKGTGAEMSLGFSLLGKYPFTVNEKLTWFPMLGIEYQIALVEKRMPAGKSEYNRTSPTPDTPEHEADWDKNHNSYRLSAWNSLWVDVGAGLDYDLPGPLYLRGELLFGFRLPTIYELGALEMTKQKFSVPDPKLSGLTGSPTLKVALGYRFY